MKGHNLSNKKYLFLAMGMLLFPLTVMPAVIINTYTINSVIPDAGEYLNTQSLSVAEGIIGNIEVSLNISGYGGAGFNGDLYVTLAKDTGGFAVLLNRSGKYSSTDSGYSDNGYNVVFRDNASNGDIHIYRDYLTANHITLSGPLSGIWQPDGRSTDPDSVTTSDMRSQFLSSFVGTPVSGQWRLFVADLSSGAVHKLDSWELTITVVPEPEYFSLSTSLVLLAIALSRHFGRFRYR